MLNENEIFLTRGDRDGEWSEDHGKTDRHLSEVFMESPDLGGGTKIEGITGNSRVMWNGSVEHTYLVYG